MRTTLLLASLLVGCGTSEPPADAVVEPAAKAKAKAKARPEGDEPVLPATDDPDVVLVIVDTLRADHTSLCGYERPTTPFLLKLVADQDATYTCEGYTPGAWTLPSHATYFTGVLLPEHHYDSMKVPDWSEQVTLADRMNDKGYETIVVTANPVLTRARGLTKGFKHVLSAEEIDEWRRGDVIDQLRKALGMADLTKPLFLVVNIMDAHDPYPAVPADLGWAARHKALDFKVKDRENEHPYHQFLKDELEPKARAEFLEWVVDGYDYGISQADETVKEVLGLLARRGRVQHGMRLYLTSDHGEFLGEKGLLRHGGWLWEPVVKVPFLAIDTRKDHAPPKLPDGPFSTASVFDLVLTGELPSPPRPVVAFSSASNFAENPGNNSVAVWSDAREKLLWTRERESLYDLPNDPDETKPTPLGEHALRDRLAEHVAGYKSQVTWRESQDANPDDLAALEALGYVEKASQ